jgi:hypothetical protein
MSAEVSESIDGIYRYQVRFVYALALGFSLEVAALYVGADRTRVYAERFRGYFGIYPSGFSAALRVPIRVISASLI